jgi:Domain of unknown function (DUF4926)
MTLSRPRLGITTAAAAGQLGPAADCGTTSAPNTLTAVGELSLARLGTPRLPESKLRVTCASTTCAGREQPSPYGQNHEILGRLTGATAPGDARPGGEAVTFDLYQRVVLTGDLPEEGLRKADIDVVVEHYPASEGAPEGYELEFFAAAGQTIGVVSVSASVVRAASSHEVMSVRELARA